MFFLSSERKKTIKEWGNAFLPNRTVFAPPRGGGSQGSYDNPRPSYAPKNSPAPKISLRSPPPTPSPLPRRSPTTPSKKVTHGPEPLQNQSPAEVPQSPLTVRDLFWGTFFGSIHFLTRACFLSRRMAWDFFFPLVKSEPWRPSQLLQFLLRVVHQSCNPGRC